MCDILPQERQSKSSKFWRFSENETMAVSQELLDILACPVCIKSVHLTADGKGLRCDQCKRIYPIVDDIPVMLIEEAAVEQPPEQK